MLQTWNKIQSWHSPGGRKVGGGWDWPEGTSTEVWLSAVPGSQPPRPFNVHALTDIEPQSEKPHPEEGTFLRQARPLLSPLFSFSPYEPCYPGFSTEAVKEDGEPSYLRMITIVNIHGWFTYHSWLHRHGSRSEASAGVAWWYILHCATMDLCIL